MKVLVTCPPMLARLECFEERLADLGMEVTAPEVVQALNEEQLLEYLPSHDGWIAGDDAATDRVLSNATRGRLRAVVKWGVGTDNVDIGACERLGLKFANTPGMFGKEVADIALGYVIALARHTFEIDRAVRGGLWPKPSGISLSGKRVALVGYGSIGRELSKRLAAVDMEPIVYDPSAIPAEGACEPQLAVWPDRLNEAAFIVFCCALTRSSHHMLNEETLALVKPGIRVVNVSRGAVIDERALCQALEDGRVAAAALDVMDEEPLGAASPLRRFPACIFGSHNSSNTVEAVERTSLVAIQKLADFLG